MEEYHMAVIPKQVEFKSGIDSCEEFKVFNHYEKTYKFKVLFNHDKYTVVPSDFKIDGKKKVTCQIKRLGETAPSKNNEVDEIVIWMIDVVTSKMLVSRTLQVKLLSTYASSNKTEEPVVSRFRSAGSVDFVSSSTNQFDPKSKNLSERDVLELYKKKRTYASSNKTEEPVVSRFRSAGSVDFVSSSKNQFDPKSKNLSERDVLELYKKKRTLLSVFIGLLLAIAIPSSEDAYIKVSSTVKMILLFCMGFVVNEFYRTLDY